MHVKALYLGGPKKTYIGALQYINEFVAHNVRGGFYAWLGYVPDC